MARVPRAHDGRRNAQRSGPPACPSSSHSPRGVHRAPRGRNAKVLLADREGRDRIVLRVDEAGEAVIEIRDAQGRITFRAPDTRADKG